MLSQTTRLFSEEFQTENILESQYHEAEIKSHGLHAMEQAKLFQLSIGRTHFTLKSREHVS